MTATSPREGESQALRDIYLLFELPQAGTADIEFGPSRVTLTTSDGCAIDADVAWNQPGRPPAMVIATDFACAFHPLACRRAPRIDEGIQ